MFHIFWKKCGTMTIREMGEWKGNDMNVFRSWTSKLIWQIKKFFSSPNNVSMFFTSPLRPGKPRAISWCFGSGNTLSSLEILSGQGLQDCLNDLFLCLVFSVKRDASLALLASAGSCLLARLHVGQIACPSCLYETWHVSYFSPGQ